MVPNPWKKPLMTPSTATTKSPGASTLKAKILYGVLRSVVAKKLPPKNSMSATVVPLMVAKSRAHFSI